jgi:hypothetical protein
LQDIDLVCAHAFECQINSLIGVSMWKIDSIHEITDLLRSAFIYFSLECRSVYNAYTSPICH